MGIEGELDVMIAHFGRFQTGTSIQAQLFYPPVVTDACKDMNPSDEVRQRHNMEWKGFVIVKDGQCTFEEKARNVQAMGAQVVLIAEDASNFVEKSAFFDSWSGHDGSGASVHIPTILVRPPHGQALIDLVEGKSGWEQTDKVILKADITIANMDEAESLSYSLYYGSILDLDSQFILRMYEYQHALQ